MKDTIYDTVLLTGPNEFILKNAFLSIFINYSYTLLHNIKGSLCVTRYLSILRMTTFKEINKI